MVPYVIYGIFAVFIISFLVAGIRILREYERAVVFTLGRYTRTAGPGLIVIIPVLQQAVFVDVRTIVDDVPPQDVVTRDNVSVRVDAVIYYRITHPHKAIINVAKYKEATAKLAQSTLRSILGKHTLDDLLTERDTLSAAIQEILDHGTEPWGIKVSIVEIQEVDINETIVRAIAMQAEAERLRRAKVINAEGECQTAERLVEAGRILAQEPNAMALRYFFALHDIANDRASTILFPLPSGILDFLNKMKT